jgi:hypothetical protein
MIGFYLPWHVALFRVLPALLWDAMVQSTWTSRLAVAGFLTALAVSWWLRPVCECVCQ